MKINLHLHSQCSDGRLTTEELAEKMKTSNYKVVALTDHDTVEGIPDMVKNCRVRGVRLIPGIEVTSFVPQELRLYDDTYKVHIVGLNIDTEKMQVFLSEHNGKKIEYHSKILEQYGIDAACIKTSEISNRIFCAELLVRKNYFNSLDEALSIFHCSEYIPEVEQVIEEIHEAGGIAVWAHPFILPRNGDFKITPETVDVLTSYFVDCGLDGMEGYYLQFSLEEQTFIEKLCQKNNLYCSTGTDYHADYDWEENLLKIKGKIDSKLLSALLDK